MYYQFLNYYKDYNNIELLNINNANNINKCFICYDGNNAYENVVDINNVFNFKTCTCKGPVHNSCIKKWIKFKSECPFCRKYFYSQNTYVYILHKFKKKIMQHIQLLSMLSLFLYLIMNINLVIQIFDSFIFANLI